MLCYGLTWGFYWCLAVSRERHLTNYNSSGRQSALAHRFTKLVCFHSSLLCIRLFFDLSPSNFCFPPKTKHELSTSNQLPASHLRSHRVVKEDTWKQLRQIQEAGAWGDFEQAQIFMGCRDALTPCSSAFSDGPCRDLGRKAEFLVRKSERICWISVNGLSIC